MQAGAYGPQLKFPKTSTSAPSEKTAARHKRYYEKNREKILKRQREKYANNVDGFKDRRAKYRKKRKDKLNAYGREYRRTNKEALTDKALLKKYGITAADRDRMLREQGGVCLICAGADPKGPNGWAIDHCHDTGAVRGILCNPCNMALGLLQDTSAVAISAADYLKRHGK